MNNCVKLLQYFIKNGSHVNGKTKDGNSTLTLHKSHSRTIGAFTNDLLHKTTYIPIKLALFWVMLGSWPFESKQILTWPFQRGIIQLCRSKGCQMTSPQSPAIKCCLAGLALAQLEPPAAASAGATPNLSLDLRSRLPTLKAGHLAALWPTELYDTSLERSSLNLFGFKRPRT